MLEKSIKLIFHCKESVISGSYSYNPNQEISYKMTDQIRLTKDIHGFVRGHLSWKESLRLLDEIIESDEWLQHLEIDILIHEMALENFRIEQA